MRVSKKLLLILDKYFRAKPVTKVSRWLLSASEPAKMPVIFRYLDVTLHRNPARLQNIYRFQFSKIYKNIC